MPIIKIDEDEWYPVYSICSYGEEVEVTEEELMVINEAFAKFADCQKILSEKSQEAYENRKREVRA